MLTIDYESCSVCGTCTEECHKGAIEIVDEKVVHHPDKCIYCGHCLAVCPMDSIMIDGDGYDVCEVEDLSFSKLPSANMMRNLILKRRAVRHFSDVEPTEEEINLILEAGKYAPTAYNRQGNCFLVVKEKENREKLLSDTVSAIERIMPELEADNPVLAKIAQQRSLEYKESGKDGFYYNAPVVINVFSDDDIDGSIAATMMNMMAESQKLGICMAVLPAVAFNDEQMRNDWYIPEGKKSVMSLLLGNPESEYFSSVPRKNPLTIRR